MAGPFKWREMKVGVSIRNPWDRAFSWFYYSNPHKKFKTFEEWILAGMPTDWRFDPSMEKKYQPRFHYQEDWFEEDGKSKADILIRFEHLQEDWEALLKLLGIGYRPLPHLVKKDRPREDYRKVWTPKMLEVAEPVYGSFARKYGYTFGDSPAANSLVLQA
jgi:hypothetical protein